MTRELIEEIAQKEELPSEILHLIKVYKDFHKEYLSGGGDVIGGLKIMDKQKNEIAKLYKTFTEKGNKEAK